MLIQSKWHVGFDRLTYPLYNVLVNINSKSGMSTIVMLQVLCCPWHKITHQRLIPTINLVPTVHTHQIISIQSVRQPDEYVNDMIQRSPRKYEYAHKHTHARRSWPCAMKHHIQLRGSGRNSSQTQIAYNAMKLGMQPNVRPDLPGRQIILCLISDSLIIS
jgi:hypothetical protein